MRKRAIIAVVILVVSAFPAIMFLAFIYYFVRLYLTFHSIEEAFSFYGNIPLLVALAISFVIFILSVVLTVGELQLRTRRKRELG